VPIIRDTHLVNAIAKAGKENTSELESYHAHLNRYAPKMTPFSYSGMKSRYVFMLHYFGLQLGLQTNRTNTLFVPALKKVLFFVSICKFGSHQKMVYRLPHCWFHYHFISSYGFISSNLAQ
jgi:hypothetical protein